MPNFGNRSRDMTEGKMKICGNIKQTEGLLLSAYMGIADRESRDGNDRNV